MVSKENLVLAQMLKQANAGKWYSEAEIHAILEVYDIEPVAMRALIKKLKARGLV